MRIVARNLLIVAVIGAIAGALISVHQGNSFGLHLLFGLFGAAPGGVVMALTGEAMSPDRRAFGMGVFYSFYFIIVAIAPAIGGWLYDYNTDPYWPILFAVALFGMAALVYLSFRFTQKRLSISMA